MKDTLSRAFKVFIFFGVVSYSGTVCGQEQVLYDDLKFKRYDTQTGILHSRVLSILQDQQGFMWIGTERGLNRYDGRFFKHIEIKPADSSRVLHTYINKIEQCNDGTMWLAAWHNLIRYNPSRNEFLRVPVLANQSEKKLGQIGEIYCTSEGGLVIESFGKGVIYAPNANNQSEINESYSQLQSSDELRGFKFAEGINGEIWFGSKSGKLGYIDKANREWVVLSDSNLVFDALIGISINDIYHDIEGKIWLGTTGGLYRYAYTTNSLEKINLRVSSRADISINVITVDQMGNMWLGTQTSGLVKYIPLTGQAFEYQTNVSDLESLPGNTISEIVIDKSQTLWVITDISLAQADLNRKKFEVFRKDTSAPHRLSDNLVSGITKDISGNIWVSTVQGLNRSRNLSAGFEHYMHVPEVPTTISGNSLWSVYADKRGNLWASAFDAGLDRSVDGGQSFRNYRYSEADSTSFPGLTAFVFYEDKQGRLWIGTDLGLVLFDYESDSFCLEVQVKLPYVDAIRAIVEDAAGGIWYGGEGVGLWRLDPDRGDVVQVLEANGEEVLALEIDQDNVIWVGTQIGMQLAQLDSRGTLISAFQKVEESDGLANNGVVSFLEDNVGRMWVFTALGVSRVTKRRKQEQDKDVFYWDLAFRNYDAQDGLSSSSFFVGPAYKDVNGHFYVGSDRGLTVFNPLEIVDNPLVPEVKITDVQLMNRSIEAGEKNAGGRVLMEHSASYAQSITLTNKDKMVSISFAGLHFANPSKIRYKYKLEGFQDNWTPAAQIPMATYTNLPAGEYTFRVAAANPDGVWNHAGTSLQVIMLPPFWQTIWFQLFFGSFMVFLLGFVYASRTRLMRYQNQRLEKEVALRTDELNEKNVLLKKSNVELYVANYELKSAIEAKDDILDITAHDLKNPLGGVIGLADIILEDACKLNPEAFLKESKANALLVKSEAEHMLSCIHELLDKHRSKVMEKSKGVSVAFNHVVLPVIRWNTKKAGSKDIRLVFENTKKVFVEINLVEIQRVIDNLLSNAIKFSYPGSTIKVKVSIREEWLRLSVVDSGPGLTDEDKKKVFKKMQRLSAKPTAGEHSTGLGLYIVKELVEKHGGTVGVESKNGNGATFWFELKYLQSSNGAPG